MKLFINHFPKENFESQLQDIKDVDFSLFVDYRPTNPEELSSINILVLQEPNEYFGHHDWAIQNKDMFSCIFTWSDKVLANCPNAVFLQFGSSWVTEEMAALPREKIFQIGHLCGEKLLAYGHYIRHEILFRENEIKIPKKYVHVGERRWPQAIKAKEEFFGPPMFAVVIENTSHNGYFTEKITDCMLLKTIPLYWGCSSIDNFYNKDGIIKFQNADDFIQKCNQLTPEYYYSKLDIIEENFKRVQEHQKYEGRICNKIKNIFTLNNIR